MSKHGELALSGQSDHVRDAVLSGNARRIYKLYPSLRHPVGRSNETMSNCRQ